MINELSNICNFTNNNYELNTVKCIKNKLEIDELIVTKADKGNS